MAYSPIPKAYNIHLKQSVYLYLFVLPLQLHPLFKAYSILITALATFTYIGVDMIGTEIENPFGTDDNDLPLDSYVNELQSEMDIMFQTEWNPSWHSTTNTTAVSFPPPPSSSTNPPTLPPLEKLELELPSKRISLASSPTSP
ncbi:hypothetical protein HMI55_005169 [Coelomomyces lativittatus]|nr:hypothetical protein HMI55_005169 [Coelomomyces lativittatus]